LPEGKEFIFLYENFYFTLANKRLFMTPTELLKPRYEVIADYPGSLFELGEIVSPYKEKATAAFDKYPDIFRPLQWYEHRKPKDMPEYVKWRDLVGKAGGTEKEFEMHLPNGNSTVMHIDNYTPATEAEYQEYLKTKV
jgi:hypothetical protein